MGNKLKAIFTLGIAVVIVGVLHLYVFAPKKAQWDEYNQQLDKLSADFKSITSKISTEKGDNLTEDQPLVFKVDQVIQIIKEKNQSARQGFDDLDKKLKVIERYDSSVNYREEILRQIERMRALEASSNATKLTISNSWDVDGGITEGRFGTGFQASGGRAMAYANTKAQPIIDTRKGTIEFFVKPDWDPSDTEVHHKCLIMAIDSRKLTRENITERLEMDKASEDASNANPFDRMNVQNILPQGPGPFQRDSMIAIYKGEGATLSFEMRDYVKPPSILTAYISDWKKGQWYHIVANWEPKRQALFINGQNRGVPFGSGGQSIRDARDAEEDALFLDASPSMGMMGMGGMGMMGMGGMGMMGMGGMGMMGMGGMGMMGMGMGGGSNMGPTAGTALTTGISLPSLISGIYVGSDETGGFAADCIFDDLRILDRSVTTPTPNEEIQKNESTLLIDHFNNELPNPESLPNLLAELSTRQRQKSTGTINPMIREYYESSYVMLRHALGINESFLKDDYTRRVIHELYCLDYISKQTGSTFEDLVDLFLLDREILKNDSPSMHRIVEFQKLCYDLAQQAVDDQIVNINKVTYKGHGYNVSDEELAIEFSNQRKEKQAKIMGEANILTDYDWAGGGMMGGMGMGMMGGMGGMGMGMGGMGMGMGMMGMGGYGGMGSGLIGMFRNMGTSETDYRMKAQQLGDLFWTERVEGADPAKIAAGAKLTIEEKIEVVKYILAEIEQFKTYQKYHKDGLIPPEVIEKYNKGMEDNGQDYYIKRSLTMDLNSSYAALMKYMYSIEYGERVQTINAVKITNKENDIVAVTMDIESHTLKNVIKEEKDESAAGATTGGVSMR